MTKAEALGDVERRKFCDEVVERAAVLMAEAGAPVEMIVDRFVTYGAAQAASIDGSEHAAEVFHQVAAKIRAGLFHIVTGERGARH